MPAGWIHPAAAGSMSGAAAGSIGEMTGSGVRRTSPVSLEWQIARLRALPLPRMWDTTGASPEWRWKRHRAAHPTAGCMSRRISVARPKPRRARGTWCIARVR
jgi:hypothetical protein